MPVITPSGLEGLRRRGRDGRAAGRPRRRPPAPRPPRPRRDRRRRRWRDLARPRRQRILAIAGLDAADGIAGDHQVGSNDWVVAPVEDARPATRSSPTTRTSASAMPSVWFMNGLHCRTVSAACPCDVAGVSFPGVPGVVLGHNARIAWGATNVDPDVEDLFVEPAGPERTPTPTSSASESIPFEVRHETIKVAGGGRCRARRPDDPPRPDPQRRRHAPRRTRRSLALRWTATDDVDGTFEAIFNLDTASNFEEFHAAFATYGAPSQNFVYADVDGHIGYVLPGRIPIRADAADHGDRIRSGSDGKHDWTGTIPIDDLPWQLDPPSGMIVTANNAAVDAQYPYFIAQEWDPGYRAKRITDAARRGRRQRTASRPDEHAPTSRSTDGPPGRARRSRTRRRPTEPATPDGKALLERIASWDGWADDRTRVGCDRLRGVRVPADPRPVRRRARRRSPATTSAAARRWQATIAPARPARRRRGGTTTTTTGRTETARRHHRPRRSTRPARSCGQPTATRRTGRGAALHQATFSEADARLVAGSGRSSGTSTRARSRSPAPPARSTTSTTGRRGRTRTRTTRTTSRSGSASVFESRTLPSYRLLDRHERPRRRADRPDDRPERQPVRQPLRRPDRPVAGGRHGPAAVLADGRRTRRCSRRSPLVPKP